ncbi:hypothetical protein KKC_08287, partial [Listeria fleischmannii subsp. coloradonensis]
GFFFFLGVFGLEQNWGAFSIVRILRILLLISKFIKFCLDN